MSDKNIKINFVEEVIRIKIKEGIQGTVGATGTTGAASTVVGTTGNPGTTGAIGTTGVAGTTDHSLLTNLGFSESGHVGFQKQLVYSSDFKCYEIE